MNKSLEKKSLPENTLQRTGGLYLTVVVFISQIISSLGAFVAIYLVQVNAELSPQQLSGLSKTVALSWLIAHLFLLLLVYFYYKDLRLDLGNSQKKNKLASDAEPEIKTWEQLTTFSGRHSIFLALTLFVTVFPTIFSQVATLNLTTDQLIYALIGFGAAILSSSIFSLFLLEYLLTPAYKTLAPKSAKENLLLVKGFNISTKMQGITIALVLISILLVAPIGYHQTFKALETGEQSVLKTMQMQSLFVAILTIAFGYLLSHLFARSVSAPLSHLIETFKKIEVGDLEQRADVTSPDETGELAIYFNSMVSRLDELQHSLETQIAQRTEQIQASAEVGRIVSSILDPDELIERVVNLITERLGYYYASIFLISSDGYWAEIKSATGEAGKTLQERKHRLSISGKSMVGSAINLRKARIAHDAGAEAVRFDNPLLPNTRSEIALPLIAGGRVLGALDAQSTEANAFQEEVVETLQGMANQVAVALENARLFQQSEEALREIRASHQVQLGKAWSETLADGDLEFSTGGVSPSAEDSLNIPLAVRDQSIGEIILEGGPDWLREDQDWVEAVATQAALALENARLLEDSQQLALQERLVAEITSKIWSSTTPDGILKIAIRELGNALGASEAVIELDIEEE
ncbi:MAG: GAF domain-containing protein [Chloroflexi bacterium]|nr:GAF domain-containing protein [Chloroflexota bacterium]